MNSDIYDDIAIESLAKEKFGIAVDIKMVIVRGVPTGHTTDATVFLTTKNQLYALITGLSPLTLGGVRKIVRRMSMVADVYLAPKDDPEYFDRIATGKFRDVFPGRQIVSGDDLRFYRQLVPYNPALVRIAEVEGGTIRQFDAHDTSQWRTAAKYAYKRIKTT